MSLERELGEINERLDNIQGLLEAKTKDHEDRLRFLEKGFWIVSGIAAVLVFFKDKITDIFA